MDWVVAHKRLLEALWDSAIEEGEGEGARRWKENMGKRTRRNPRNETEKTKSEGEAGETREEPRCSGLARRGFEAAAGCASATWRGSPRH